MAEAPAATPDQNPTSPIFVDMGRLQTCIAAE
jgi:hypothetical protein